MSSVTHSRSVLLSCLVASAAPAPATTTSADFSLQQCRRPFRREARSPQVRTHTFIAQPPHLRRPSLGHKSFVVSCPLPLLGNAFYAVLVHRLTIYAPHFLPTLGRPYAVVLHFAHCDQLAAGLSPAGVRPCWAHIKNPAIGPGSMCGRTRRIRLWLRCGDGRWHPSHPGPPTAWRSSRVPALRRCLPGCSRTGWCRMCNRKRAGLSGQ